MEIAARLQAESRFQKLITGRIPKQNTAEPALPGRWCALQAAPGLSPRRLGRHGQSAGLSLSDLAPLRGWFT
jgi:hypothetical protein